MASVNFASMSNKELESYIKDLQESLINVGQQLRGQTHLNRGYFGNTNEDGKIPDKDEAKFERRNFKKQQELLSNELQAAKLHQISRQIHGE